MGKQIILLKNNPLILFFSFLLLFGLERHDEWLGVIICSCVEYNEAPVRSLFSLHMGLTPA